MALTETCDYMPWPPIEGRPTDIYRTGCNWPSWRILRGCLTARDGRSAAEPRPAMAAPKASAMEAGKSGGSDIPSTFTVPTTGYDYVKREVMIPMRDGVKLYTVIVVPKERKARRCF